MEGAAMRWSERGQPRPELVEGWAVDSEPWFDRLTTGVERGAMGPWFDPRKRVPRAGGLTTGAERGVMGIERVATVRPRPEPVEGRAAESTGARSATGFPRRWLAITAAAPHEHLTHRPS